MRRSPVADVCFIQPAKLAVSPRRRFLLASVAAAGCALPIPRRLAAAAGPRDDSFASFVAASTFLTGRSHLDPAASIRAWTQLTALDSAIKTKVAMLMAAVKKADLTDMTAFLASPLAANQDLRATARTIVSAWYLGHTGLPVDLQDRDTTGFVTYRGAMMFSPTINETVIPTFSRAGPDYWLYPPPGTPTPPGPSAHADWSHNTVRYEEKNFEG